MKAIIQRVKSAKVTESGKVSGEIEHGFLILLGAQDGDTKEKAELLAKKTALLRIFRDEQDKMNLSLLDVEGSALVVSNFTLCADVRKGHRPSFINAMEPTGAEMLYEYFCECLKKEGVKTVEKGVFGGDMELDIKAYGPVTITLDTDIWSK